MVGVDDSGALLLAADDGSVERVIGGELSLRRELANE
jgi:biotin-(acetyl-CoA carboxylase) ligase